MFSYQKRLISVVLPLVGFEKGLFKRMNEKRATETEAYLFSVSNMWLKVYGLRRWQYAFYVFLKRHQGFSAPTENIFHILIGGSGVQLSFFYCSIAATVSFAIEILFLIQLCRDAETIQVIFVAWLQVKPQFYSM